MVKTDDRVWQLWDKSHLNYPLKKKKTCRQLHCIACTCQHLLIKSKEYINVHSEDFTSCLLWMLRVWHKMKISIGLAIVIEGLFSLWVRWPTPAVETPSKAVYSSLGTESIVLCSLGTDLSANDFSSARHLGETVAVQCWNWICWIVCLPIRTDWCSCLHGAHLGPALQTACARKKTYTNVIALAAERAQSPFRVFGLMKGVSGKNPQNMQIGYLVCTMLFTKAEPDDGPFFLHRYFAP